jgi:hypothetical protein
MRLPGFLHPKITELLAQIFAPVVQSGVSNYVDLSVHREEGRGGVLGPSVYHHFAAAPCAALAL